MFEPAPERLLGRGDLNFYHILSLPLTKVVTSGGQPMVVNPFSRVTASGGVVPDS